MSDTVKFPTMDAISYSRMKACNAADIGLSMWSGYPQTELSVPLSTICPCCNKVMADDVIPIMSINNAKKNDDDDFAKCHVVSVYRCSSCNSLYAIWSYHTKTVEGNYDHTRESKSVQKTVPYKCIDLLQELLKQII